MATFEKPHAVNAAEPVPAGFLIEVLQGLSGFLALRPEWDALYDNAANPQNVFQSHAFLRHWAAEYVGEGDRLYFVCGRIEARLAMVWPLVISRKLGIEVMTIMGAPVAQFFDILIGKVEDRDSLLDAGWNAVSTLRADVFIAHNVRQDASIRLCTKMRFVELPGKSSAPYAKLRFRLNGDELGSAYTPRIRSNYRRRLRRADEHGKISFGSVEPGALASALAGKAISFKQSSLLRKQIWSPTVRDPRFRRFFEQIAADRTASLCVSTINCDDKEIGIELSFDSHGHTFGHVLATDPDSRIEGLGSVLVIRSFMSAVARGAHTFEMMLPADAYKMQHADGALPVSSLAVAFTPKGRLYRDLYLGKVQPFAKDVAKKFAAPIIAGALKPFLHRRRISQSLRD